MTVFTSDKSRTELINLLAKRYDYTPKTMENYIYTNKFFSSNVYDLIKDLPKVDKKVKEMRANNAMLRPNRNQQKTVAEQAPSIINVEPRAIEVDEQGIPYTLEDKKQMAKRMYDTMKQKNPELIEEYGPFERTKSVYMSLFCAIHKIPHSRMHSYIYTNKLFKGLSIPELIFKPDFVIQQIQEFEAIRIKESNKLQEQRTDKEISKIFQDGIFSIPVTEDTKKEDTPLSMTPESIDSSSLSAVLQKIDSEIMKKQQEIQTLQKVKTYIQGVEVK